MTGKRRLRAMLILATCAVLALYASEMHGKDAPEAIPISVETLLVSSNQAPRISNKFSTDIVFPIDYDFADQNRIYDGIVSIVERGPSAFGELVKLFDDGRYC